MKSRETTVGQTVLDNPVVPFNDRGHPEQIASLNCGQGWVLLTVQSWIMNKRSPTAMCNELGAFELKEGPSYRRGRINDVNVDGFDGIGFSFRRSVCSHTWVKSRKRYPKLSPRVTRQQANLSWRVVFVWVVESRWYLNRRVTPLVTELLR